MIFSPVSNFGDQSLHTHTFSINKVYSELLMPEGPLGFWKDSNTGNLRQLSEYCWHRGLNCGSLARESPALPLDHLGIDLTKLYS